MSNAERALTEIAKQLLFYSPPMDCEKSERFPEAMIDRAVFAAAQAFTCYGIGIMPQSAAAEGAKKTLLSGYTWQRLKEEYSLRNESPKGQTALDYRDPPIS